VTAVNHQREQRPCEEKRPFEVYFYELVEGRGWTFPIKSARRLGQYPANVRNPLKVYVQVCPWNPHIVLTNSKMKTGKRKCSLAGLNRRDSHETNELGL
jgi:hypothetical protein